MTVRRPLVLDDGIPRELPTSDSLIYAPSASIGAMPFYLANGDYDPIGLTQPSSFYASLLSDLTVTRGTGPLSATGITWDSGAVFDNAADELTAPLANIFNTAGTIYLEADLSDWATGELIAGMIAPSATNGIIAPKRWNYLDWSEDFSNSYWLKINITQSGEVFTVSAGTYSITGYLKAFISPSVIGESVVVRVSVRRDQSQFVRLAGFGNGGNGVCFDVVNGIAQINGSWIGASINLIDTDNAELFATLTVSSKDELYIGPTPSLSGSEDFSSEESIVVNYAQLTLGGSQLPYQKTVNDTINQALGPSITPSGWTKIALRYGNGKMRAAVNGSLGTEANFDGDWNLSEFSLGDGISGKIRNVKTWNTALNDVVLQGLTNG